MFTENNLLFARTRRSLAAQQYADCRYPAWVLLVPCGQLCTLIHQQKKTLFLSIEAYKSSLYYNKFAYLALLKGLYALLDTHAKLCLQYSLCTHILGIIQCVLFGAYHTSCNNIYTFWLCKDELNVEHVCLVLVSLMKC